MLSFRTLGALAGAWALLSCAPAGAAPDLSANAALQYWQAFSVMPKLEKDEIKLLADWENAPLDAKTKKFLDGKALTFKYLYRGASLAECHWGIDYNDGVTTLLMHIDKGRMLGRLACLRGRYEIEKGNARAGAKDLAAALALARHLGTDGSIIGLLVQRAQEKQVVEYLAARLPDLDAGARKPLVALLEALPKGGNLKRSVQFDRKFGVDWLVKELGGMKDDKEADWQDKVVRLFAPTSGDEGKKVRAMLKVLGDPTPAKLARHAEALRAYWDGLLELTDLPPEQAEPKIKALHAKHKDNPLAASLAPLKVTLVWEADAAARARLAMFRAALLLAEGKEAQFKALSDPFGKGPFKQTKAPGGFELESQLKVKGEPVKLRVGRPKKD